MKVITKFSILITLTSIILLLTDSIQLEYEFLNQIHDLTETACENIEVLNSEHLSQGDTIRNILTKTNPKLGIEQMIEEYSRTDEISPTSRDNFIHGLVLILLPWAIFIGVVILMSCGQIFCLSKWYHLFLYVSCPPCSCCRLRKAKRRTDLKMAAISTFCLQIIVISVCVAGLVMSPHIHETVSSVRCSMMKFYRDLSEGTTETNDQIALKWKGLEGLQKKVETIDQELSKMIEETEQIISNIDSDQLFNQYQQLIQKNNELNQNIIYTDGQSYYVQNSAITYIKDGTFNQIDPFVRSKLVNISPQQQVFEEIYRNILSQVDTFKSSGEEFIGNQQSIKYDIQTAKLAIEGNLEDFEISAKDTFQVTETYNNWGYLIQVIFIILFSLFGLFSIMTIIALIFIYPKRMKLIRFCGFYIVQYNCLFNFILILIGLTICTFSAMLCAILNESCGYYEGIIHDQNTMLQSSLFSADQKEILTECLFEDGNILKKYNIIDPIEYITDFEKSIDELTKAQQQYQESLDFGNHFLQINKQFIQDFTTFKVVDIIEPNGDEQQNFKYKLKNDLLECIHYSIIELPEQCFDDQVFYDPIDDLPEQQINLCIQSTVFAYQNDFIKTKFQDCQNNDFIPLNEFYQEQNEKWLQVLELEETIITFHQENQIELNKRLDQIIDFVKQVSKYLQEISDPDTGLFASINCKFFIVSVERVSNDICVRNLRLFYIIWILFVVISVTLFISTISMSRIIINYKNIQEIKQDYKEAQQPFVQVQDQYRFG